MTSLAIMLPAKLLAELDDVARETVAEGGWRRHGSWNFDDAREDLRSAAGKRRSVGGWLSLRGY